jgi:putative lipase involved disintegration of autophagic bodies
MGKSIVFDTVNGKEWKWSVHIRNHPINVLIDSVLTKNVSVPEALTEDDCVVGF